MATDAGTSLIHIAPTGVEKIADKATQTAALVTGGGQNPDAGTTTFQILSGGSPLTGTTTFTIATSGEYAPPGPALDTTPVLDCIDLGDERALRMMAAIPPYLRTDPTIRATLCTVGRELNRFEAALNAFRLGTFPLTATESTLEIYEQLMQLHAETSDGTPLTLDERRAQVDAHLLKRRVAKRYDWQQALTEFIGTSGWSYSESPPYTVNLTTPFDPTGDKTAAITAYARKITPSHLVLVVNGNYAGFQIGISHIGTDRI